MNTDVSINLVLEVCGNIPSYILASHFKNKPPNLEHCTKKEICD